MFHLELGIESSSNLFRVLLTMTSPPKPASAGGIKLRRFPWPYRAMLAFSSDIDAAKIGSFRNLHRFLHTGAANTSLGRGVELDVADSFWFYDLPNGGSSDTTYYGDQEGMIVRSTASEMIDYVKAGWIDTLHTYGNFNIGTFTPDLAERAVDIAHRHGVSFPVWADHGNKNNRQNVFHAEGAAVATHIRSLRELGVRFVADPTMDATFERASVLRPVNLADGSPIWAFYRNCRIDGIADQKAFIAQFPDRFRAKLRFRKSGEMSSCTVWHPPYLAAQIDEARLQNLVDSNGFAVVGQHLNFSPAPNYQTPAFARAFHRLAKRQRQGDILVTRTSRLLRYNLALDYLTYFVRYEGGNAVIDIASIDDPVAGAFVPSLDDLAGIQFLVPLGCPVRLIVAGRQVSDDQMMREEVGNDRCAVGLPWHEPDTADYVPTSVRSSAKVLPGLVDEDQSLVDYFQGKRRPEDNSPEGDRWNYCIDRALVFFHRGLDHYRSALQGAGLSRGNWLLDIGCGSAHWLLAALDGCEKVSGVELSPEYVALASGLVKARGLDERMSVVEGSAETLPFPSGQFDRALSHSVLHFVDAERAFAEVRRVLSPEGLFYCAATGPGARIAIALSAIQGDKKPAAKAALRILLGGAIRLSGLASPPWSSTRALNLGSYIKIGEACGFSLVRTPDVQDIIRGVPNFPGTFDVLFVKGAAPFSAREHFTQALATAGCSTSDFFEHLLRNSMPGLVYRAVIEDWASLDPTARAIWLGRSELAGSSTPSPRHLDAAAAAMQPLAREVFMGLRALGAGRPAAARQHFAAAGDEGDAPLLLATLDLNTNTERAHRRFRQLAEAQPERLWSWAGLLMSALMGGKASEIQRAAALARARLHSGVAHRV